MARSLIAMTRAALAALALVLTAGCAGGPDQPAGRAAARPVATGTCPLLDAAEASRVLEVELRELVGDADGCGFISDDGSLSVVLAHSPVVDDPEGCPGSTPVAAGEGVTAYVCEAGGAPQGFWFRGEDEVVLVVSGTETTAKAFSSTVDLLPSISVPS